MAKITNLVVLNPSDKTRHYSVCMGEGVIADADDPIVTNVKDIPQGSQYTNVAAAATNVFYVRIAQAGVVADWKLIGPTAAV